VALGPSRPSSPELPPVRIQNGGLWIMYSPSRLVDILLLVLTPGFRVSHRGRCILQRQCVCFPTLLQRYEAKVFSFFKVPDCDVNVVEWAQQVRQPFGINEVISSGSVRTAISEFTGPTMVCITSHMACSGRPSPPFFFQLLTSK
jgi:hypothetical protein